MTRIRLHSEFCSRLARRFQATLLCLFLFSILAAEGLCAPVDFETARTVAQNKLQHHISLYGHWNGSTAPTVIDGQAVEHQDVTVAYNFRISPSGHVLVAADQDFSPILLYSAKSSFDPGRRTDPNRVESWIIPELHHNALRLSQVRAQATPDARLAASDPAAQKISSAWQRYAAPSQDQADGADLAVSRQQDWTRSVTVGPLLTTTWGQDDPYNLLTPENGCTPGLSTDHTLTGCVATAWAQVARYWRWPVQGSGSHSYDWNGQQISADFSSATYDWDNMPDVLSASSDQTQKDAVALLMFHMGVAAEMDYGCDGSGSNAFANDVFDIYFGYKTGMSIFLRSSYTADEWFALFQAEFDADPPRPVPLSIFATTGGGHEVVADGYQNDSTDLVHINMGWDGYDDAFYNVTSSFQSGGYIWSANSQIIVTNIQPDDGQPSVDAGSDRDVDEATDVQLSGSVLDLGANSISSYAWAQTGGPAVALADATTATATFTAPAVSVLTPLIFKLEVGFGDGSSAADTVIIAVENTDAPPPPQPPSSSGRDRSSANSSSGCFIMVLY